MMFAAMGQIYVRCFMPLTETVVRPPGREACSTLRGLLPCVLPLLLQLRQVIHVKQQWHSNKLPCQTDPAPTLEEAAAG